jgi:cyclic pyranopterin phosphate synthase
MPAEGIPLSPKSHIMTYDEIQNIAKTFVQYGVTKIRLTGGEPLIRKDFPVILKKLSLLPVELTLTTNGVIVDRFLDDFKDCNLTKINLSLDSLNRDKFKEITRRSYFDRVYANMLLLLEKGFTVKMNVVLIRGFNDDEIMEFINLTKELPLIIRFIEFMPFDGNKWNIDNMVSYQEIMDVISRANHPDTIEKLEDSPNDTSKNYRIKGYVGSFAIISSVTNPFCDSCNRIRLTANGHIKNCLFSSTENDLLTPLRNGESIEPIIEKVMKSKFLIRGGMDTIEKLKDSDLHSLNRSMITIGG